MAQASCTEFTLATKSLETLNYSWPIRVVNMVYCFPKNVMLEFHDLDKLHNWGNISMGLPKMPSCAKGAKNLPISMLVHLDEGFLITTKRCFPNRMWGSWTMIAIRFDIKWMQERIFSEL